MTTGTEQGTGRACPNCGAALTTDPRFVAWCPACDWNVDPEPAEELGRLDRRLARLSEAASRRMYEDIATSGAYRDRGQSSALHAVALLIHGLTVVTLLVGIALITGVFGTSGPIAIVFGAVAVVIALFVQPFRPSRHKPPKGWLTRTEIPQTFALIDEIAGVVGADGVDGITLNSEFNAWIVQRDGRWQMNFGMALWAVLSPEERAGLIAHELGHQVNGDQRREWLVRSAMVTMSRWASILDSRATPFRRYGGDSFGQAFESIGELLALIMMAPISIAAAGLTWALYVRSARQGMSAEYYADMLESKVSGTEAAARGLEKLLLAEPCRLEARRVGRYETDVDPWQALSSFIAGVPETEFERRRRAARLRLPAVDSTHPPTQLRADLLRRLTHETGRVTVDAARMAAIDAELAPVVARVTERFRSNLRG